MIMRLMFSSYILVVATAIAGCSGLGDVPPGLRVDTGLEPQHLDEQVRFRTTYYFRVLEGCPIEKNIIDDLSERGHFVKRINGNFVPLNDSLYRFRMTGQAAALFNRIHFESGVLRKEQIDPFGSAVHFNTETNSFLPTPADHLRAQAKSTATINETSRLRKLFDQFKTDANFSEASKQAFEAQLNEIIQNRLESIKANPLTSGTVDTISSTTPQDSTATQARASSAAEEASQPTNRQDQTSPKGEASPKGRCNGQPSLKKYYLLGPEGSKELDPNDRLLMALSVDSKPLIGMLQQISEHKFQSQETSLHLMEALLDERSRIFDAQRTISRMKDMPISEDGASSEASLASIAHDLRKILSPGSRTSSN